MHARSTLENATQSFMQLARLSQGVRDVRTVSQVFVHTPHAYSLYLLVYTYIRTKMPARIDYVQARAIISRI